MRMIFPTFVLLAASLGVPSGGTAGLAAEGQRALSPDQPPPEEMIDFFGRRRLCLDLQAEGGDEVPAGVRKERARLACDRLPAEERAYRAKYAGDPLVTAWLNDDPRRFRVPGFVITANDGPPLVQASRFEETGTDHSGKVPFKVVIETGASEGRSTTVTISYADLPPRTVTLENARFPGIDVRSVAIAVEPRPEVSHLSIDFRYGYGRGYCSEPDDEWEDRPASASFSSPTGFRAGIRIA